MDYNKVTTTTSFVDKIKGAFFGVIFGIILFIGSFILLWWNEGNCVKVAELNSYVKKNVISIDANSINPAYNNKLVHVTGEAVSNETLSDDLNVSAKNAIALFRDVEMYQWQEEEHRNTRKNAGGSSTTTTTYSYEKQWSSSPINSSSFNQSADHQNPSSFPISSTSKYAQSVKLGAFDLSQRQIQSIKAVAPLTSIPRNNRFSIAGSGYYSGTDINNPQIGDIKIAYTYTPSNTPISVIAEQNNNYLIPDITPKGEFSNLSLGIISAENIMQNLDKQNAMLTMGLRILGFVLMAFGLQLLISPITVLADVLPPLAYFVDAVSGMVLSLIALALSLITITLAWLTFRPLISIPVVIALIYFIYWIIKKKEQKQDVIPSCNQHTSP